MQSFARPCAPFAAARTRASRRDEALERRQWPASGTAEGRSPQPEYRVLRGGLLEAHLRSTARVPKSLATLKGTELRSRALHVADRERPASGDNRSPEAYVEGRKRSSGSRLLSISERRARDVSDPLRAAHALRSHMPSSSLDTQQRAPQRSSSLRMLLYVSVGAKSACPRGTQVSLNPPRTASRERLARPRQFSEQRDLRGDSELEEDALQVVANRVRREPERLGDSLRSVPLG
jgi:hypothetical protein